MKDLTKARALGRESGEEAFSHLPNSEPERSRTAEAKMPSGFYANEMKHLEGELGREPTEEEKEVYVSGWEERYEELVVEGGLANNIRDAQAA